VQIETSLSAPQIAVLQGGLVMPLLDGAELANGQSNAGEKGIEVSHVMKGSKAEQSGLRDGDLILSVNQKRVYDLDRFAEEGAKTPMRLSVVVIRDGKQLSLTATTRG
jgi:S1-C subfamily serine protease